MLLWWAIGMALLLAYAGLDAAIYPEHADALPDQLTLDFNPEKPWAFLHAGARLWGALGWPTLILYGSFFVGFIVTVLSLFVEDDDD